MYNSVAQTAALLKRVFVFLCTRIIFSISLIALSVALHLFLNFVPVFSFLTGLMSRNCSCCLPARFHLFSDSIRINFQLNTLLISAGWAVWETPETQTSSSPDLELFVRIQ